MLEAPKGTVTFLFTDIEGSTRMWEEHPDVMKAALARHDEIVRGVIEECGGYVFATGGDGFAAAFGRAADAVHAAIDSQVSLGLEPWPDQAVLRIRMGIHTGEVEERKGNYFGPPVNRAARLMGAAAGGQVVLSSLTAELLDASMRAGLVDLGAVWLKGVAEPIPVFGVSSEGFDWLDRPLESSRPVPGNLPQPLTEFVGSIAGLRLLASRATSARLLTLTGSGGVGKTRTAVEIGWLVVEDFPDGVWIAELAPVADPAAIHASIAAVLGATPKAGLSMAESIVDWCRDRQMLLIIDNCEHVLDPVVELVSKLSGCESVSVVATSREPLGLVGERVVRVPSIEVADGLELFTSRAVAVDSAFDATDADLASIAAICQRLDGIPLAIELAAARIRMFTPAEMLDRLDDRFRLLRGGGRGGIERHQTLRATVNWSYQLLSETERVVFDRVSVFAGGFDITAVEAVCGGDDMAAPEVVDVLGALVDQSMVMSDRSAQKTRFRLLETLRQFGEERLDDRGETATRRDMHLAHYVEELGRAYEAVHSERQVEADATISLEWDNARSAHEWAVATSSGEGAESLLRSTSFHASQRLRRDHDEWTRQTLEIGDRAGSPSAFVHQQAAFWSFVGADLVQAMEFARRGMYADPDNPMAALCRAWLAWALLSDGQVDEAVAAIAPLPDLLNDDLSPDIEFACRMVLIDVGATIRPIDSDVEEFAARAAETGAPHLLAVAQRLRGNQALLSGNRSGIESAVLCYLNSVELSNEIGSRENASWSHLGLASAAVYAQSPDAAARVGEALSEVYDARHWVVMPGILSACALHLARVDETEAAAEIVRYVDRHHGGQRVPNLEIAMGAVGPEALRQESGTSMTDHEIVAYALAQLADE